MQVTYLDKRSLEYTMIKQFFLFFFLYIIFTNYTFSQNLSHKERDGLVGQVKQITLSSEIFSEDIRDWKKCSEATITMYDSKGYRIFDTSHENLKTLGNAVLTTRFISTFDFEKKGKTTTKETKNKDGVVTETRVFVYDQYGFCTNFILYDLKGIKKETEYEYEYDRNGNWITETDYQIIRTENVRKPIARYKREIEYYK